MDSEGVLLKGNIPMDLVIDILLRLPAKAVGRCMCTCKTWYSLIKSTEFITSHLIHSKIRDNTVLIVQEGCYSVFSESDTTLIKQESGRIPFPVVENDLYILGSCRGLVLVRFGVERDWQVFLWNPSLEKSKLIDTIRYDWHHDMCTYALGFHEASNDYRVVRIDRASLRYFPEEVVAVYSVSKDSWHQVDETLTNGTIFPTIAFPDEMANCVNGAVHWLATCGLDGNERFVIASFDFDNEVLKVIELPNHYNPDEFFYILQLKELNGKLALFTAHYYPPETYNTWVMMNYPLVESWIDVGYLFEHEGRQEGLWPVICTRKENCVFREYRNDKRDMLLYYNAKEDKIYELEVVTPYLCPVIVDFVECLVLLDVEYQVLEDHTP